MNCFQISIFAVANTTKSVSLVLVNLLWIAFKLVSLQLQTQRHVQLFELNVVVNCFQISIFAVANTTDRIGNRKCLWLWIAFKLVSLQLQTQPLTLWIASPGVVNCFQISIFAVANTTFTVKPICLSVLWIAFKLVSLQLQTQPIWLVPAVATGCELLSN